MGGAFIALGGEIKPSDRMRAGHRNSTRNHLGLARRRD